MQKQATLQLTQEHIIGVGYHKTTYVHPEDDSLCVKIPFTDNDIDLERELKYRSVRNKRQQLSTLLPAYRGTVFTNKGTGYIFERICDYDGKTSLTLTEYIDSLLNSESKRETKKHFQDILTNFYQTWLAEKIVTSDVDPANFLVQRKSATEAVIRIVDNIGTPVLIPLAFYIDSIAERRIKRYWKRFVDHLKRKGILQILWLVL